ncbi:MAG: tRNA uridine-5-carboxymethylaminomethyl(34) synthesis enzyme MnmG [bacterium]|nr:tRNA uridine-5-carboxymethylaminomethyl(34) synthesis enzyme MnmG [bacterium]
MVEFLVIGGGHAGVEAASAAARMGVPTALITQRIDAIGRMSCNPAIGGLAKGHLVVELDPLGGLMPQLSDATGIQFRLLNRSKGPAVWGPRCQSDKDKYSLAAQTILQATPNLEIWEDEVLGLLVEPVKTTDPESSFRLIGLRLLSRGEVSCQAALLGTGTFLGGIIHCGEWKQNAGRIGEQGVYSLADDLKNTGFRLIRLKTGTPPRIKKETIDYSQLEKQDGDERPVFFHALTKTPALPQTNCWIARTSETTHKELEKGFDRSPMFTGRIKGIGPRYCPSIEDKINRFADRTSHQLFVEPEGLDHPWMYLNGFSTSLPEEVQLSALRTMPGFADAEIARPGYAVEYDAVPAEGLLPTFESRKVKGLYFAGQINGTSGYEEAAAQGFWAGVNAALAIKKEPPFVLRRDEAYIGVLCDDLRLRVPEEPYRMFTSRAEYRLLLRVDSAPERLLAHGERLGLVTPELRDAYRYRMQAIADGVAEMSKRFYSLPDSTKKITWKAALSREGITLDGLLLDHPMDMSFTEHPDWVKAVETRVRYEGYFVREARQAERLRSEELRNLPIDLDYHSLTAVSAEARDSLSRHRPATIGEASRLAGVTPADLLVLLTNLRSMALDNRVDKQKS